jgi:hypothetical protein
VRKEEERTDDKGNNVFIKIIFTLCLDDENKEKPKHKNIFFFIKYDKNSNG